MDQHKRDQEPKKPNKDNQPEFDKDQPVQHPKPDRSTADDRGKPDTNNDQDEVIRELDNPDVEGWDN